MLRHKLDNNLGFTLIELMITVVIIAIIAAIAVPSYTSYVKRAGEAEACQAMMTMSGELNAWQAKALSFRGFAPQAGFADSSKTFYTPADGTSSDYRYEITVLDAVGGTTKPLGDSAASGRYWRMKAKPTSTGFLQYAHQYYLDSTGVRCMFISSANISLSDTDVCGDTNAEEWSCG